MTPIRSRTSSVAAVLVLMLALCLPGCGLFGSNDDDGGGDGDDGDFPEPPGRPASVEDGAPSVDEGTAHRIRLAVNAERV
jgi:hypothetical protein